MPIPLYSGTDLFLCSCTGICIAVATSQLCVSPGPSPKCFFAFLCHVIACAQQVAGWDGPHPHLRTKSGQAPVFRSRTLKGKRLCKGLQDGVGPKLVCRLARKASSGQRANVRVDSRAGGMGRSELPCELWQGLQSPLDALHGYEERVRRQSARPFLCWPLVTGAVS